MNRWKHEDILVGDLGILRVTGDASRVMLSALPDPDALQWKGIPFRVHASWVLVHGKVAPGCPVSLHLGQSDAFMLGKPACSRALDDDQADEVRELMESVVTDWLDSDVSQEMLLSNSRSGLLSTTEVQELTDAVDRGTQQMNEVEVSSVAEMEDVIRGLSVARTRLASDAAARLASASGERS